MTSDLGAAMTDKKNLSLMEVEYRTTVMVSQYSGPYTSMVPLVMK